MTAKRDAHKGREGRDDAVRRSSRDIVSPIDADEAAAPVRSSVVDGASVTPETQPDAASVVSREVRPRCGRPVGAVGGTRSPARHGGATRSGQQ